MKMIDTVVLTFDESQYFVTDPDKFEPSLRELQFKTGSWGGRAYKPFKNNPTSKEIARGAYRPRMTITARFKNRQLQNMLKVEFSAPKIIYKNNMDELTDKDFPELTKRIQKTLAQAGVSIAESRIAQANVSAIHFSKNLVFRDGSLASKYTKEIRKCNVTFRLDSNSVDYRNEGHAVKFRANSFEIAFYDKIQDLSRAKISPKRTEEKNGNLFQMGLFDQIKDAQKKQPLEVLRFEARLNQRRKINQVLQKIGVTVEDLTFKELFSSEIAQKVLLYYLNELKACYPKLLLCAQKTPQELVSDLAVNNLKATPKDILALVGMQSLLRDSESSTRQIKRLFEKKRERAWERLRKSLSRLKISETKTCPFDVLIQQVKNFQTVKLTDLGIK